MVSIEVTLMTMNTLLKRIANNLRCYLRILRLDEIHMEPGDRLNQAREGCSGAESWKNFSLFILLFSLTKWTIIKKDNQSDNIQNPSY
jgi:hypothetical protein